MLEQNLGWRIDYIMINRTIISKFKRSVILSKAKHSDHSSCTFRNSIIVFLFLQNKIAMQTAERSSHLDPSENVIFQKTYDCL